MERAIRQGSFLNESSKPFFGPLFPGNSRASTMHQLNPNGTNEGTHMLDDLSRKSSVLEYDLIPASGCVASTHRALHEAEDFVGRQSRCTL